MEHEIRLFIRTAIILIFSISSTLLFGQSSKESITKEILSTMELQVRGWNSGSIEQFMQGYAKTDSVRFASGGNVVSGWKTMLHRYQKNYSNPELMGTLLFSEISVTVVSDSAALVFGKWELLRKADKPWGLFTLLFKNIDGKWLIIHDHTSSSKE
jgi:hypothetical protein